MASATFRLGVGDVPTWRRRRSDAEKARIAAESLAPDAVVADIARRQGALRAGGYTIGVDAFGSAAWRRRRKLPHLPRSCR